MKRVLLDVDGVVADFRGAFYRAANVLLPRKVFAVTPPQWDISAELGLSNEEESRIYDWVRSPGYALRMEIYAGAVAGVATLRQIADVYFVTSPVRLTKKDRDWYNSRAHISWPEITWMHDREEWLMRTFGVDEHHVVHTSSKELICGDFFVDDKPAHVDRWAAAQPGLALIWDQPYNRDNQQHRRVCSWEELLEIVK